MGAGDGAGAEAVIGRGAGVGSGWVGESSLFFQTIANFSFSTIGVSKREGMGRRKRSQGENRSLSIFPLRKKRIWSLAHLYEQISVRTSAACDITLGPSPEGEGGPYWQSVPKSSPFSFRRRG
jgi:hypothetical protein